MIGSCVFHEDRDALPGERYCGPCRDIEKAFITEYYGSLPSGRVAKICGEIRAVSWEEAERKGKEIGHTILGEIVEVVDAPEMKGFCDREARRRDEEWNRKGGSA